MKPKFASQDLFRPANDSLNRNTKSDRQNEFHRLNLQETSDSSPSANASEWDDPEAFEAANQ